MADPPLSSETLSVTSPIEVSPETTQLIAISPAQLRIRGVYNHITTAGIACLGMFVPLLALLAVPSECTPHSQFYLATAIATGIAAIVLLGYAFFGQRREENLLARR